MFVWTRVLSYEMLEVKGVQASSETRSTAAAPSPNTCDRTAAEAAVHLETSHANTNQADQPTLVLFAISLSL